MEMSSPHSSRNGSAKIVCCSYHQFHLTELSFIQAEEEEEKKKKEPGPAEKSTKALCDLDDAVLRDTTSLSLNWGTEEGQTVVWEILPDGVNTVTDENNAIELWEHLELSGEFLADDGLSLTDQFFKYIFPHIKGHAKIIDKTLL